MHATHVTPCAHSVERLWIECALMSRTLNLPSYTHSCWMSLTYWGAALWDSVTRSTQSTCLTQVTYCKQVTHFTQIMHPSSRTARMSCTARMMRAERRELWFSPTVRMSPAVLMLRVLPHAGHTLHAGYAPFAAHCTYVTHCTHDARRMPVEKEYALMIRMSRTLNAWQALHACHALHACQGWIQEGGANGLENLKSGWVWFLGVNIIQIRSIIVYISITIYFK